MIKLSKSSLSSCISKVSFDNFCVSLTALYVTQNLRVFLSLPFAFNAESDGHTTLILLAVDKIQFFVDILPFVIKVGVLKTLDYMYINLCALTQEREG